jgi:hypothetical protein
MIRTLRSALALLVVCFGLVAVAQAPAFACSCKTQTWKQQLSKADAVFVATVDDVVRDRHGHVYSLTATRSYKGEVERQAEVASPASTCGLGELRTGKDYLFVVRGEIDAFVADQCGGTTAANPRRIDKVEAVLGDGRAVPPPPPPAAELTRVEESPPIGFARLAAPGGAAVIVAALGLLVVRRLARR